MPVTTRAHSASLSSPVKRSTLTVPTDDSITTTLASSDSDSELESESDSSEEENEQGSDDDDDELSESDSDTDEDATATDLINLDTLLQKAKLAARNRAQLKNSSVVVKGTGDDLAGNEEMVLFGSAGEEEDEDDSSEGDEDEDGGSTTPNGATGSSRRIARPLPPSLAAPLSRSAPFASSSFSSSFRSLFPPNSGSIFKSAQSHAGAISLAQDLGTTVLADQGAVTVGSDNGKGKSKARDQSTTTAAAAAEVNDMKGDKWGVAPLPKLSKKQIRAKQPHTAGAQWYHMPATPMTPELKREIDALRLSNQLDPKKFLRGGAKRDKVGEFFQIGHIIAPSTRATTLSSQPTIQKRSFVEDLLDDEQSKAYAKRKTKEVLAKSMSGRKRQRKGGKGAYAMGEGGNQRGGVAGGKKKRKV